MLKQIERYTQVTGTSIYECDDKWQSNSEPSAVDVQVTLPALEFESADVQFMGTLSVPDTTRLGNIQVTAALECDNPKTRRLVGPGLKRWRISWVQNIVWPNQTQTAVGFTVFAAGYVAAVPEGAKELGSASTADYTMNCVSISKKDSTGYQAYDVDRATGKLIVDGVDYRADVNKFLG